MQNPEILPASTADYPELIAVWEAAVRATHDFLSEADILQYRQLILEQYFDTVRLYCIKDNNRIIAFMGINGQFLQMLFIHPDWRGKGIGKILVLHAISAFGIYEVDVNEQNTQAVGFYYHLGFELAERFHQDAAGKPYPILAMVLKTESKSRNWFI